MTITVDGQPVRIKPAEFELRLTLEPQRKDEGLTIVEMPTEAGDIAWRAWADTEPAPLP